MHIIKKTLFYTLINKLIGFATFFQSEGNALYFIIALGLYKAYKKMGL